MGGEEYINNIRRYCLWLENISPAELKKMPLVMERIEKVKNHRLNSKRGATVKLASTPYLFGEIRQPKNNYIVVPLNTSSKRTYIPIGFIDKDVIASNLCSTIDTSSLYNFGVITSMMHMVWTKYVCGRLGSGYRYSKDIVYNNFPWPLDISEDIRTSIEIRAKGVLSARAMFPDSSLADLYDPLTMPKALIDAHNKLDLEVDKAYGVKKNELKNESDRIKFLFKMYEKYIDNLM